MPGRGGRSGGLRTRWRRCGRSPGYAEKSVVSAPGPVRVVSITGDMAGLCHCVDSSQCRPESRRAACFVHMPVFPWGPTGQVPCLRPVSSLSLERETLWPQSFTQPFLVQDTWFKHGVIAPAVRGLTALLCAHPGLSSGSRLMPLCSSSGATPGRLLEGVSPGCPRWEAQV